MPDSMGGRIFLLGVQIPPRGVRLRIRILEYPPMIRGHLGRRLPLRRCWKCGTHSSHCRNMAESANMKREGHRLNP